MRGLALGATDMKNVIRTSFALLVVMFASALTAQTVQQDGVTLEALTDQGTGDAILSFDPQATKASALSFSIEYPAAFKQVDTSNCLADMPSHLSGGCKVVGDVVKVILYNPNNEPIGPMVLGTLSFGAGPQSGSANRGAGNANVRDEIGRSGQDLSVGVRSDFAIRNVDIGTIQN
jgi:hypothetical protein